MFSWVERPWGSKSFSPRLGRVRGWLVGWGLDRWVRRRKSGGSSSASASASAELMLMWVGLSSASWLGRFIVAASSSRSAILFDFMFVFERWVSEFGRWGFSEGLGWDVVDVLLRLYTKAIFINNEKGFENLRVGGIACMATYLPKNLLYLL